MSLQMSKVPPKSQVPTSPAAPAAQGTNRFNETPLNYGLGVSFDQVLKYNSKGEYDFERKIMLKVADQFWSTKQALKFSFFVAGIFLVLVAALLWNKVEAKFSVHFFTLGAGISLIQAVFPHGLAKCDPKTSQMRKNQGCFSYLDCTNTENLTPEQKGSCKVPLSTTYRSIRYLQFILLVIGIVLVATTSVQYVDAVLSCFMGFGIFYAISYSL